MNSEIVQPRQMQEKPSIGVYNGITPDMLANAYSRNVRDFEHNMSRRVFGEICVDSIITKQLRRAARKGRDNVVVVDLGGGDGEFTRQFLSDPTVSSQTRNRLRGKDESVILYSITDAQKESDHLLRQPITPRIKRLADPIDEKMRGVQVNYSVTTRQPVADLLKELQVKGIDLAVASNFMSYLRVPVFKAVTEDVIGALRPGGQFLVFGYAGVTGEMLSSDDGDESAKKPIYFLRPTKEGNVQVSTEAIRHYCGVIQQDKTIPDSAVKDFISNVFSWFYATGVCSTVEEHKIRSKVEMRQQQERPRVLINSLLKGTLSRMEDMVAMYQDKVRALHDIQTIYADSCTVMYDKQAFRIQKREK